MKKPFDVLRYRYIAMGASGLLIAVGIVLFFVLGFNAGIDFASGYSERFQIAPLGFTATYSGPGSAVLSVSDGSLALTLRTPEGMEEAVFPPSQYPSSNDIAAALKKHGVETRTYSDCDSRRLVSGFGFPSELSSSPARVNFASDSMAVSASDVREALSGLGSVNVQSVGGDGNAFQIRMGVDEGESQSCVSAEVEAALDAAFGAENVVVLQSDFIWNALLQLFEVIFRFH